MEHIIFITPASIQVKTKSLTGLAAVVRTENLARAFSKADKRQVHIISRIDEAENMVYTDAKGVQYHGIGASYASAHTNGPAFFRDGQAIMRYAKEVFQGGHIIFSPGSARYALPLLWTKDEGLIKGFYLNDWYNLKTMPWGARISAVAARSYALPQFGCGIVVSDYLAAKYAERMPLLKIPSLMNEDALLEPTPQPVGKPVRIAYAGDIIGRKDYVDNAIRALPHIDKDLLDSLEIHLFGAKREQLTQQLGQDAALLQEYAHKVIFHGFMPQEQLRKALATMDYTMLFRPDLPYTRAGFANKFAESLAMGVPVIANITGDMAGYLRDGQEGIIAKSERPQDIALSFTRAISVAAQEHENMRKRAYEMARKSFWIENYKDDIEAFLCLLEDRREQS